MSSSFVGTTVRLTPREGAPFFGTILSVDPKTATLSLRRADTSDVVSVRREDLIDVSTVTLQTPSPATRPELADKKKRNRKKSERTDHQPQVQCQNQHQKRFQPQRRQRHVLRSDPQRQRTPRRLLSTKSSTL